MRRLRHVLFVLMLLPGVQTLANHILGGDITYTYLGGDQYTLTLNLYVDCFGATQPPAVENLFINPTCGLLFSATADLVSVTEISDVCTTELANTSCNGGFIPGTWLVTYETEPITMDLACPWEISWASGDWNYFINMNNAGLPTAYFETIVDLSEPAAADASASFDYNNALPVDYVCMGDPVIYDLAVNNPSNYDLAFSFTNVLTTGGVPAPYEAGYSGASPIPGAAIDPVTGQITFNAPMMIGSFSVGVLVEQFDGGGNLVGSFIESIAFIVRPCIVAPTVFTNPGILSTSAGGTQIGPTAIQVCQGDSVCFTVEASNADIFRTVTITSDFEVLFPGATMEVTGINPTQAEFCLLADPAYPQASVITIDAEDDNCDNPGSDQLLIDLTILPSLETSFFDTLSCVGEFIALQVEGDTDYTWNVVSGDPIDVPTNFSCTDCGNPLVSPAINTVYEVIGNNVPAQCNQADTITVNVSLSQIDTLVTIESCAGNDGAIDLSVLVGSGNYQYNWSGPNGFLAATQDINGLEGGQYEVLIVDLDLISCDAIYPVFVDDVPPPTGTFSGDATICEGECTDLTFTLTGTGPFDLTMAGVGNQVDVNDGHVLQVCPTTTTTYTFVSVTDNNSPSCTTPVGETVTVTVRPVVDAAFLIPSAICVGDDIDIELDLSETGSYVVEYTDGTNNFVLNPAQDGDLVNVSPAATTTYSVTSVSYTDAPQCANTNVVDAVLTVNALPTASLSGTATICNGSQTDLTFNLTGTGPFNVTWTDGVSSFTENGVNDGHTVAVSPSATTQYCITEVTDSSNPVCGQILNSCVDVTVNLLPTADLLQDATICVGDDVDLEFDLGGSQPFDVEYTVNGGLPVALNGISDGHLESVSPLVNTTYCIVSITDSNNPACTATVNECVDITVNALPTADITGASSICNGECEDVPMTLTGAGTFTIDWEVESVQTGVITDQADIVGAVNGDLINFCPTESVIVRITGITDSNNPACSNDAITEYTITVVDFSEAIISGDATICAGANSTLIFTITGAGGPYDITYEDDLGNQSSINGILPAQLNASGEYLETITPAQTSSYTIVSFTDGSSNCTEFSGSATVTVAPVPQATFDQDDLICPGETADLVLGLTGIGPYEITINDGTNDDVVGGVNDGDIYQVSPAQTTTYTLTNVVDNGSTASCATQPMLDVTITLADAPEPIQVDTLCDAVGENFQIVFEISGGNPASYSVNTLGGYAQGSISAGPPFIFTSTSIPSGSTVSFEVQDGDGCGAFLLEIIDYSCPVLTDAGTMDLTALDACEDGAATAIWNNDGFLDANDQLMFILHDNPGPALGVVYAVDCDDAGFNDADTPLNFGNGVGQVQFEVTYYITAVAGNDDGTGDCVDLNHPDISVAEGTPVVFHETPTADISGGATLCEGQTTDLNIDFTGVAPWTFIYAIDGADQAPITTSDNPYILTVQDAGLYTITSVSNDFCTGTTSGDATVAVNPLPAVVMGADGVICEGQLFPLQLNLTGTPNWEVDLVYQDAGLDIDTTTYTAAVSPFFIDISEAGSYYVSSITDGNGCTNDLNSTLVDLTVNSLPTASLELADTTLCEGQTVDIPVILTGNGAWDVIYNIGLVDQPVLTEANDTLFITVGAPGTYELTQVTDANGCVGNVSGGVTITTIPVPVANAGPDFSVCSGVDAFIGTPAQAGLTYSWDDPNGVLDDTAVAQPVFNATNQNPGAESYLFELTVNEGNCFSTDQVEVTVEPEPLADAGDDVTICFGASVVLEGAGGVACQWEASPSLDDPSLCNPTATPADDEEFVLQVEGANGCFANDTIFVTVADELLLNVDTFTPEICFSTCDGEFEASASGGTEPYTLDLTYPDVSVVSGFVQTGLCQGDYSATLTDDLGCQVSQALNITELPEYIIADLTFTADVCFEESAGEVTITSPEAVGFFITGQDTLAPNIADGYQYLDLPSGNYEFNAINNIGCVATESVQINDLPEIFISVDDDSYIVCYQEEVTFSADAQGGSGAFTYFWMTQSETPFDEGADISFTPANETTLLVYALDAAGCSSDTLSVTVGFNEPFQADLDPSVTTYICEGDQITISADLSGGLGFPAPLWVANSTGEVVSNQTSFTISPEDDELYILTVTDGCTEPLQDTVLVVVMDTPVIEIGFDEIEGCAPVEVTFTNLTNPALIDECIWNLGDGTIIPACLEELTYTYSNPGFYFPSLTVTSEQGCQATGFTQNPVVVHGYPVANFTWTPNPPSTLENEIQLINQTQGGINFEWDFGFLGTSTLPNPTIAAPTVDFASVSVCLEAINQYGCADSICQIITLDNELLIFVPNAFTPDGDGINEYFLPQVQGVVPDEYEFRIFDRWGQVVFETDKLGEAWVGNNNGGEHFVQNDVYVWQIVCRVIDSGDKKTFYGHVTIVR